ncbi:S10 family peptidase [Pseudonocardia spinosispora]|uniref:S10 family peptidase n=1 Tax=Pseudonocardia spinosispora TaxID=103441 RepID=UPI0004155D54|nr:peptidase S10 [Pseudonocardia spinosispora]
MSDAEATTPEPEPTDDLVETRHTLITSTGELAYTATAGRIVLRTEQHTDGAFDGLTPTAEVFVVAYTADSDTDRPLTIAFNGGPGSASVWLHLGLLGPRRVLSGDAGAPAAPPYRLVDNAESLLAHSDLLFIDPVSTGYSRAVRGGKPSDFHGFTADLEAVAEVIRLWVSRNQRWLSPKYLVGESYGTLRAAALAGRLQERYGMYLNGLALISTVLDMGCLRFTEGNLLPYPLFLPTYAAIAHYHGLHGDRPLREVLDEAEQLAERDYPWALARGARLSSADRDDIVARLASVTGLSPDYLRRVRLRIEHQGFYRELLRSRGLVVGRLDGRFTGWEADDAGSTPEHDPSYTTILGPYAAALNAHLRGALEYRSDLPYETLTDQVQPWSYREFEGRAVSVSGTLASAMRANPHLRIQVGCGYHDGATPYYGAEHMIASLAIPDELRPNIEFRYYEAGHMTYVHEPSRIAQSADLAAFITG